MISKKKIIGNALIALLLLLQSCTSVEKINAEIEKPKSVNELKSDVDYIQQKLRKLHPDLYHYITKQNLDYKFDSLRSTLTTAMTSNEFYFRLSPVIAAIRQGHTQTFPLTKKLKKSEKQLANNAGTSPLTQFNFELFDNKLYIVKNNSKDSTIKVGTEVLSVNGIKPQDILAKYETTFCSDGFNTTFIPRRQAKVFSRFFYQQYGFMDSVSCQLTYADSTRTLTLKPAPKSKPSTVKKSKEQLATEKQLQREESRKKRLFGYDAKKRIYSKELSFPVKDSSVAIIRIADFVNGNSGAFYKKSFQKLDSAHTKTLIIDIRDNTGGHLREVSTLYSYLADSSFRFIEKSEVVSKTSLWHLGMFNNKPLWEKALRVILIPSLIEWDIYSLLATHKGKDNKYRFALSQSRVTQPKIKRFRGKVYVLINGGCFSASSLLSSNLQGSKRATFVGQETGGANNGCVAGIMPVRTLPNSRLTVSFGLLVCNAPYQAAVDGRGIFPDVEITPTLNDRITGNDPELQWVLNDIKNQNNLQINK